eukprot:7258178-Pyramimonas_sp.AAC.1
MQHNATTQDAMQSNATQFNATQRNASQRNAMQFNAARMQRHAMPCHAMQCNALKRNTVRPLCMGPAVWGISKSAAGRNGWLVGSLAGWIPGCRVSQRPEANLGAPVTRIATRGPENMFFDLK